MPHPQDARRAGPRPRSFRRAGAAALAVAAVSGLSGCGVLEHGFLGAQGPVADETRGLFLVACAVLLFVVAPVLVLTPAFAWHYRLSNTRSAYRPQWGFNWPLEGLIWIPPAAIVVGLSVLLWQATLRLDPYRPLPSAQPPVEVQAVALDWKWLFLYPEEGVATVDQLVFPASRPVRLHLTSATVMQSFFVPRLGGQIFAMAGMTTQLNLAASRPGTFLGRNTQFNGMGFQNQTFSVHATDADGYAAFLARARADGRSLDLAAFETLSVRSIGTPQVFGRLAPDLFAAILARSAPGMGGQSMGDRDAHAGHTGSPR